MPDLIVVALIVALAAGLAVTMLVLGAFAFLRTEQLKRALTEAHERLLQLEAGGAQPGRAPASHVEAPQAAPERVRPPPTAVAPPIPSTAYAPPVASAPSAATSPPPPTPEPARPSRPPGPSLGARMQALMPKLGGSASRAGLDQGSAPAELIAGAVSAVLALLATAGLLLPQSLLPREGLLTGAVLLGLGAVAAAAWRARGESADRRAGALAVAGFGAIIAALWIASAPSETGSFGALAPGPAVAGLIAAAFAATAGGYRFGQASFALGWASGLAAPLAYGAPMPAAWLFGALLALTTLGLGVATARGWRGYSLAGLLGALGWAAAWALVFFTQADQGIAAGFLAAIAALTLALAWEDGERAPDYAPPRFTLTEPLAAAHLSVLLAAACLGLVLLKSGFAPAPSAAALLFVGAVVSAAAARPGFSVLALLLVPAAGALLWLWPSGTTPQTVDGQPMFFAFTGALALIFCAGGVAMMLRGRTPVLGGLMAGLAPVLLLVTAYVKAKAGAPYPGALWSGLALALAAANVAGMVRAAQVLGPPAAIPFALAAAAGAGLAMGFGLAGVWLPAGLALIAPLLAWLDRRLDLAALKLAAAGFAAASAWLLTASLAPLTFTISAIPVFNELLAGYGVAAAALWGAARLFDRVQGRMDTRLVQGLEAASLLVLAGMLCMQVRHLANDGNVGAAYGSLGEVGGQTLALLALATALAWQFGARPRPLLFWAEAAAFGAALGHLVLVGVFILNPWWGNSPAPAPGAPFLNLASFAYLLPALAFAGYGALRRGQGLNERALAAGAAAAGFGLLGLSLEVRRLFHGAELSLGAVGGMEGWAYVAAWGLYAAGCFALGVRLGSLPLRGFAAAVAAAALLKGFLVDAPALEGLWRLAAYAALVALTIGGSFALYLWGRAGAPQGRVEGGFAPFVGERRP